ncbi:MAG: tetratricopeptide repeat protein, partial [Candidatus Aenigmatarchaeota archaeon]
YETPKDISLKEKTQTITLGDYKNEPSVSSDEDVSIVTDENVNDSFDTKLANADELYKSKKYAEAADIYNELLKSAEDNQKPYIYNQLASISLKSKNYKKAKEYYLSAIVIIKQNNITGKEVVNAYSGLAYCFEKEGKKDSAIKNYKKAMELSTSASTKQKLQKAIDRLSGAGNE